MKFRDREDINHFFLSEGINADRRDRREMTCLIHAKCDGGILIASDSWNTNPTNHYIQKMTCNKKHPCIIASAGENSARYDDGHIVYVMDFMKEFVESFNGMNMGQCIDVLYDRTYQFLNDMILGHKSERVVQYFVDYYDENTKQIKSWALFMVKNHEGVNDYNMTRYVNMNFTSYGTYMQYINTKYIKTKSTSKQEVFDVIKKWCEFEKNMPNDQRSVSEPLQYIYMSNTGEIESQIPEFEQIAKSK